MPKQIHQLALQEPTLGSQMAHDSEADESRRAPWRTFRGGTTPVVPLVAIASTDWDVTTYTHLAVSATLDFAVAMVGTPIIGATYGMQIEASGADRTVSFPVELTQPNGLSLPSLKVPAGEFRFLGFACLDGSTLVLISGHERLAGGWMDYNDAATAITPITLTAGAWVDITNDGLGPNTKKVYGPAGIDELLDVSTGYVDPTSLLLGDLLFLRNDFIVTPGSNNAALDFRYELGVGGGVYYLHFPKPRLDGGSGVGHHFVSGLEAIYMGDDNTRANPIKMQAKLSVAGTLVNNGSMLSLRRD